MSRLSAGVAADSDAVANLEAALRVAFGPAGKGIMLKEGTTGILSVSRSSREIARATFDGVVPPPWLLPVLSAAESVQKRAGDGGKGVLLGALAVSRLELSPRTIRDVALLTVQLDSLSSPIGKPAASDIESITRTFLATRLTTVVLNAMLPSVLDWLIQDREYARKHAETLCRVGENLKPVSGMCSEGVTILCRTENVPIVQQKKRLVVILEGTVPSHSESAELVDVVIASKCLEEKVIVRLVAEGAVVLHGLSDGDGQLLFEADCTEVEVKCVKGGVWLGIPGVRQLIVCAPVATLAREIARTVQDALALVCYSDSRVIRVGALERCLLRRLIQTRLAKPPPLGRELLLTLTATKDDNCAVDVADSILNLVPLSPEITTVLGVAVSATMPPSSDANGLEPVTLRLAVLCGALSAGSRTKTASAPLPARRLHS